MAQTTTVRKAETLADDIAEKTSRTAADARDAGADAAAQTEAIAAMAREALAQMRRIVDDFAATTGGRASAAGDAVKAVGQETADRIGTLVEDARTLGRDGIDQIADQVAKRPVAALAIAAGLGMLLGLASRAGTRR